MRAFYLLISVLMVGASWAGTVQVYSHYMDPRKHPDDGRRYVKPPDQDTFDHKLQFMALRQLNKNYVQDLDNYVTKDRLGNLVWAFYNMLYEKDLPAIVQELKKRGLFLFDIWGFVPGSGPGVWQEFPIPEGSIELFEKELGDHWLGMDNGEQDGRYVGGYAGLQNPIGRSREEQYLAFNHHFEQMGNQLGNRLATLVSLNFGHYFLKEGIYTMIGAETAQALPNAQVYYSFIRGAGKQYGVPWFGNVALYNRWGVKNFRTPDGEKNGTSYSLMKRLLYNQILYNSVAMGFAAGFYRKGYELSPIGDIQKGAVRWSEKYGDPGVMHTPVAVMLDFFSGWSFPRHLYTGKIFQVWGNLPYEAGDYLTDDIFDLIYPGYRDSSYFTNERGFMAPTPFGDMADCLLSDAPVWVLRQYPVLVLGGAVKPTLEVSDNLSAYVRQGGHLVMTAENARRLFPKGIAGVIVLPETHQVKVDQGCVTLHQLKVDPTARVLATMGQNINSVVEGTLEKGKVTVFASPFGIAEQPQMTPQCGVNMVMRNPYPLLPQVRDTLMKIFRDQMIFSTGKGDVENGLTMTTCRRKVGEYTVAITNPDWQEKPFGITAKAGKINKIVELPTDTSEQASIGYQPQGRKESLGKDTASTIAGGSVRLFRVYTDEAAGENQIAEIPESRPTPNQVGAGLPLLHTELIQKDLLLRPTFFRHFDTVMVDWRYVVARNREELTEQSGWLKRQGVRIVVDFSSGCNLFPDLRLIKNDVKPYEKSMRIFDRGLENMAALGAKDLVLSLHRGPENNYSGQQHQESLTKTLRTLSDKAAKLGITLHLRQSIHRPVALKGLANWVKIIGKPNFKGAPSLAAILVRNDLAQLEELKTFPCNLVFVSAPEKDRYGQLWSMTRPLKTMSDTKMLFAALSAAKKKGRTLIFDAEYKSWDEEYLDVKLLNDL